VIKMLYAWRDHPDRTAEECEHHYRTVHMELARRAYTGVPGFRALRYSRVRRHFVNDHNRPEPIEAPPDMDAFVELWFDDRASLEAAFGTPELAAMFDDHVNFMAVDIPANVRIYELDETTILEASG
jgi:uncharacterized protein (TIGR02118 family)